MNRNASTSNDAANLVSSLQSMRDRMTAVLGSKFGDAFDGDMDTLLEAINYIKRSQVRAAIAKADGKS